MRHVTDPDIGGIGYVMRFRPRARAECHPYRPLMAYGLCDRCYPALLWRSNGNGH